MNKSPFNKILATVNGQKVLGEKVEFDLKYKEIKHIRRCLNFYNHIHPPYDKVGEEALDILKKFKRFGSMQRRSTKQKVAFRNKKDVPHICSWDGCEKKKKLTIDHIYPLRSGGTGRVDNLQWLCKRHHDMKNLTERIKTKKKEIKKLEKELEELKYLDFSEYRNVFPIGFNEDKTRFMIFFDPFNSDIDKVQKKLNERKVEYVRGSKSLHIITNPELLKSMLI